MKKLDKNDSEMNKGMDKVMKNTEYKSINNEEGRIRMLKEIARKKDRVLKRLSKT